ncbi:MAG: LPS-assembly protein LptD [Candidatus Omnitrophota bacterium]
MPNFFNKFILYFLLLLAIPFVSPAAYGDESPAPAETASKVVPIEVRGDSVEYFHEEQKAVGTGHVSVDYEGVKLTADKVTVYMATKVALAEGNVKLVQEGSVFTGERAEYNFGTKIGNVSNLSATVDPSYFGKAARVEKVSDDHYRLVDGYLTTCCGDSPFYKIGAQQLDIYPGQKVAVRNAVLYIKGAPLLFIPYLEIPYKEFQRFPIQIAPGKNSDWGAFVLTKYRYYLSESPGFQSKGNLLFDWREKRGLGGGVEHFYSGENVGHGAVRLYTLDDEDAPPSVDSERYRAQWRHQSKLGEATTFTAEINKLSDETVIKDFFFREEYERDVFPDNYISIITAKPEYTLSLLARERLNDFSTVVERSPEVRFDTYNRQFAETPFYLRQEMQFSQLNKKFADSGGDQDATRLDGNWTLSFAGRLGDLSVVPRIGTRQTYHSRDLAGEDDVVRGTFDPGLDLSTRFYKTYDWSAHAWGLDWNQVRHIFNPTASYNYRPNPTVARTTLQQFDALDAIDKQNFIRFSFENKFQTKERHGKEEVLVSREIARIIPSFDVDFDTGRLDQVALDTELRPYSWMGIESDVSYDTRDAKVSAANFDLYLRKGDLKFAVGQRYLRETSSQTTLGVEWRLNPEWSLKVYERYEFQTDDSEEFEVTLSKVFEECYIVDFTYNHHDDGDSFFVVFRLKAFPDASFGLSQSYNHPKASPAPQRI